MGVEGEVEVEGVDMVQGAALEFMEEVDMGEEVA